VLLKDATAVILHEQRATAVRLGRGTRVVIGSVGGIKDPLTYHLGSDYKRDPDGTFYVGAESYIDKMIESYERTFGAKPKENSTPLVANNHPEMDDLELHGSTKITLFQSHIGSLQWTIRYCNCGHDHVPLQSRASLSSSGTD
jgi:hypothetical protein